MSTAIENNWLFLDSKTGKKYARSQSILWFAIELQNEKSSSVKKRFLLLIYFLFSCDSNGLEGKQVREEMFRILAQVQQSAQTTSRSAGKPSRCFATSPTRKITNRMRDILVTDESRIYLKITLLIDGYERRLHLHKLTVLWCLPFRSKEWSHAQ